ncbi:hypothetical protein F5141DRAFT_1252017 [Pisolithus sp. B1]|nr:hypothetical protein F5141DRAFT_1252017 [Pisolithus sp. B1]
MAWKTADDVWHQRVAIAHQFIIYGLPDSILMTSSWLEPEEAVQQSDSSPEWNTTGETTQNARDSDNRSEDLPGTQEDYLDRPSDCAGITDRQEVETYLPVAEVGTAELERSNECSSALEVPGEHSQYTGDEVAGGWDLLESRSEAPKPAEDTSRLASGRSIESAPLLPIKDNQHLWTDDETVANVADPPGTHAEPPIPQIKRPTLQNEGSCDEIRQGKQLPSTRKHVLITPPGLPYWNARPPEHDPERNDASLAATASQHFWRCTKWPCSSPPATEMSLSGINPIPRLPETERPRPDRDRATEGQCQTDEGQHAQDTSPNKNTGGEGDNTVSSGFRDSYRVEKPMLADRESQIPLYAIMHTPKTSRDPRRRRRIKQTAESVSGALRRRSAYHAHAAPMRPLLPLSASVKRINFIAGGPQYSADVESKTTKLGIRPISTKVTKMRGNLPHSEMHPKEPGKTKETSGGGDGTKSAGRLEAQRQNGPPAPPKPAPNSFAHPPWTLRDRRRRGRIKTKPGNVSTPRNPTRTLQTLTGDMEHHPTDAKLETAALRQHNKARGRARTKRIPEMAVATTRSIATATTRHLVFGVQDCAIPRHSSPGQNDEILKPLRHVSSNVTSFGSL